MNRNRPPLPSQPEQDISPHLYCVLGISSKPWPCFWPPMESRKKITGDRNYGKPPPFPHTSFPPKFLSSVPFAHLTFGGAILRGGQISHAKMTGFCKIGNFWDSFWNEKNHDKDHLKVHSDFFFDFFLPKNILHNKNTLQITATKSSLHNCTIVSLNIRIFP